MTKKKKPVKKTDERARNLIRGALAKFHVISTPERMVDAWKQEQSAHQQIKRALALSKNELSAKGVVRFEKWVAEMIAEQNRSMLRLGTNLTSLGLFPTELTSQNLVTEMQLACDRLMKQRASLMQFAEDVLEFQEAFNRSDWRAAKSVLASVENRNGFSYWGIELSLGVTLNSDGLEALKTQVGQMTISSSGANTFLIYFFGVRNEPAQTAPRFIVNSNRRIDDSELTQGLKEYFRFRLHGAIEQDEAKLANLLACEQLTTSIDLLFTTVKIIRFIFAKSNAFSHQVIATAEEAVTKLSPLIDGLGLCLKPTPTSKISRGDLTSGAASSDSNPRDSMGSALDLLASAAVANLLKAEGEPVHVPIAISTQVLAGLMSRLSTRSDGILGEDLIKAQLNFNSLPDLIRLGDANAALPIPKLFLEAVSGVGFEFEPWTIQDALVQQVAGAINENRGGLADIPAIRTIAEVVATARNGNSDGAIHLALREGEAASDSVAGDVFLVLAANLQFENGDMQGVIQTIARAGLRSSKLLLLLPLIESFQASKWASLRKFGPSLELSICLDLFLKVFEDRKIRSFKRYSVEELMLSHGCDSVTDLIEFFIASNVENSKIEYFAYYVCDIYTVELLPGMAGSTKVQKARARMLRLLAQLRTEKEMGYLHEASEIDENISVNDGLHVLDDSKVYVDERAILNLVNKDLAADFQRYIKLVESGLGSTASFAEVLQSMKNPSAKTFHIPKNDADDLFAEILNNIREKFLFDPASGLDIIVSRRIRHGSIQGELRGHLEAVGLIGQRPKANANYDPSEKIAQLGLKLDSKQKRIIFATFSRFSEAIDQLVSELRDDYFHVSSKIKTKGIFDVQINAVTLALARSVAQTCRNIDEFSKQCLQIFWFVLSFKVTASRPTIETETKKSLTAIFGKLTQELRSSGIKDVAILSEIQQAADELQRRATVIASWIRVPNINVEGNTYSMQKAVDVAVAMVTAQRAGFLPNVTSSVPDDLELDTHGFFIVVDALYIALDNICQHSGKKLKNEVSISVMFSESDSLISFEIVNELASSAKSVEKENKLASIRTEIQRRAYGERARLDRGSGLFKLAALVMQSEHTRIEFFHNEKGQFVLKFQLVFVSSQHRHNLHQIDVISEVERGLAIVD